MTMKRALTAATILAALLVPFLGAGQAPAPASGNDLKARVSSILERFPAGSAAERDALAAGLLGLGEPAVVEACARVLPAEAGDDSRARFAVNGLAVYVTRSGAEAERTVFVRAVWTALAAKPDDQSAAFLIAQIELAGKAESVKPLAKYLLDETLAGPAAAALQTIGGPEAESALLKSLDKSPLAAKVSCVNALGRMRSRAAVKKLLVLAGGGDEGLRRAGRAALANIGDPQAGPALATVRVDASFAERAEAPALYLLFARRLAGSGRTADALRAARAILAGYAKPQESQVASEALALIVEVLGEEALPDLLAAVDGPAGALRGSALEMATTLGPGEATARWIEKASASGPDVRAPIVEMLGRRGDASALPFIRDRLLDKDAGVRAAAIAAAARLGGDASLPDLMSLMNVAGEEEMPALRAALLGFDGRVVVPAAVRAIDTTPLPGRAVLIEVLGEKGALQEIDRVFALASDPEPATRAAALGALAELASESDLPRIVARLETAGDAEDIIRLQDAAAAASVRAPEAATRGQALVDLMKDASPGRKIAILRVLPKVGGAVALRAAVEETSGERKPGPSGTESQVQTVAVYALSQWPDYAAAGDLLRIATTTPSKRHRLMAVEGYVRLVGRANMAGGRKLALFQDLLAKPFDDADRRPVLAGVAGVREPESVRLLAGYLENPVLGETAAAALLDLASEQAPHERWLSGHEAVSALRRVEGKTADPAERERVAAIILARLRQGGFTPLFDGRSLAGWKGLVADPPARAKMAPAELAKAQAEADERMRAHWRVVDGLLVFDGRGESLCTASDHGDFELLVDWKIEKGGDSGIYLRGSPQVQIWDAGANPAGSGGLYNNQKGKSQPLEKADRPVGEWNTFRIIMIGERVTVYLNDRLVVDNTVLENYWERDKPVYPAGQIELQAHGNPLYFRNVFLREIPRDTAVPRLSAAEEAEGFLPLFNGRDLAGWTGGGGGYAAEDGKIVVHPERGGGNLFTEREYADFVLRFEFKLTPAANNGLGVRAPLEGDAAYAGMEIQILEDGSPVYWGLRPYQYHGSIYGVVPARRGVLRPVGEWNTEEVTVRGRRVTVVVNGTAIVDADIDAASAGGTIDGNAHPGLKRDSGHIGFLGHGSVLEFRNIRIRVLK
jgi:HEAT repeat protein